VITELLVILTADNAAYVAGVDSAVGTGCCIEYFGIHNC